MESRLSATGRASSDERVGVADVVRSDGTGTRGRHRADDSQRGQGEDDDRGAARVARRATGVGSFDVAGVLAAHDGHLDVGKRGRRDVPWIGAWYELVITPFG